MSDSCCGGGDSCCGHPIIKPADGRITLADRLGALKVRFGIGRNNYRVAPGLYRIGHANGKSPVFVSANYKLSFDTLRKELPPLDCWILVLDTKGVNVWCAAGKGTFGSYELVKRIEEVTLGKYVSHRELIVPQLGAPGVNANLVKLMSGWHVVYGPVRARDIQRFVASGNKATTKMRTVTFDFWHRLILTPVEVLNALKTAIVVLGVLFIINLFAKTPFGIADFCAYLGAILAGTFFTPLLLPLIPVRPFALKGWILGLIWTLAWLYLRLPLIPDGGAFPGLRDIPVRDVNFWVYCAGYILLLPPLSAFYAMNFTGSSTYTSFSGVTREMKAALPLMAASGLAGACIVAIKHIF